MHKRTRLAIILVITATISASLAIISVLKVNIILNERNILREELKQLMSTIETKRDYEQQKKIVLLSISVNRLSDAEKELKVLKQLSDSNERIIRTKLVQVLIHEKKREIIKAKEICDSLLKRELRESYDKRYLYDTIMLLGLS